MPLDFQTESYELLKENQERGNRDGHSPLTQIRVKKIRKLSLQEDIFKRKTEVRKNCRHRRKYELTYCKSID